MPTKRSREEVIAAVKENRGNLAAASRDLGISEVTMWNYTKRWKTLADAVEESRRVQVSHVEGKLHEKIEEGNIAAIIFFLKTQAGWRETSRQEIDQTVTLEGQLDVTAPNKEMLRKALERLAPEDRDVVVKASRLMAQAVADAKRIEDHDG